MEISTKNTLKILANAFELSEFFKVEEVDGKKRVNRWGFYSKQNDGTYAVYKPETAICEIGACIAEDGPGDIKIVEQDEIFDFLSSIDELVGISWSEINEHTACGWYYDTIIPTKN